MFERAGHLVSCAVSRHADVIDRCLHALPLAGADGGSAELTAASVVELASVASTAVAALATPVVAI